MIVYSRLKITTEMDGRQVRKKKQTRPLPQRRGVNNSTKKSKEATKKKKKKEKKTTWVVFKTSTSWSPEIMIRKRNRERRMNRPTDRDDESLVVVSNSDFFFATFVVGCCQKERPDPSKNCLPLVLAFAFFCPVEADGPSEEGVSLLQDSLVGHF